MQTIMTTFEAHRDPSLPNDIYNPLANMVAGIRYAESRYGTLDTAGVLSVENGGAYQGYKTGGILGGSIPFQVLDQGGFLPTGLSAVFNGTGSPEAVPGPGGGGYSPTYNLEIGGNVTAETMQIVQSALDAHDRVMIATLNAGRQPMSTL